MNILVFPAQTGIMTQLPVILTIAGSDPTAGAGLQADIKTASRLGVYAMTAVTAVTVQNGLRFSAYNPVAPGILRDQIEAVAECVHPDAVKVGLLPSPEAVEETARCISRHGFKNVVVDPVLSPTLSDNDDRSAMAEALRTLLFPLATLVTPNLREASQLLRMPLYGYADAAQETATLLCSETGCRAVLVTGGDSDSGTVTDTMYESQSGAVSLFTSRHIDSPNTHGTGCVLSSAIASYLALGKTLHQAVAKAEADLHRRLAEGISLRLGSSPYGPFII